MYLIVGYIGKRRVSELLLGGLSKLEYKGYDPAWVAIIEEERIVIRKLKGRLSNLENDLKVGHGEDERFIYSNSFKSY